MKLLRIILAGFGGEIGESELGFDAAAIDDLRARKVI